MSISSAKTTWTTRSRSFQKGAVTLWRSKGCKVPVCHTLWIIQSSGTQIWSACMWFDSSRILFSNLQIWQLIKLQPFNLQRSKYLFRKILILLLTVSAEQTASVLKIGFALSNWPQLLRVYSVMDIFSKRLSLIKVS